MMAKHLRSNADAQERHSAGEAGRWRCEVGAGEQSVVAAALYAAVLLAYAPALSAPLAMDDHLAIAESSSIEWRPAAG